MTELEFGHEEAASIATIEKPETMMKVIEIAPELRKWVEALKVGAVDIRPELTALLQLARLVGS